MSLIVVADQNKQVPPHLHQASQSLRVWRNRLVSSQIYKIRVRERAREKETSSLNCCSIIRISVFLPFLG